MDENRPTIPPLQPNNREEDWLEQTRRYGMRPSDFVGAVEMRSLAADVARIAALEAELAQARTELERLRQPYSRLDYHEWSDLEGKQDYRALAYAFESDSRAMHDENEALRARLAGTWQPVNGDESKRIMCACPDEGCYKAVEWDGTNLTIYVDVSEFDAGLPSLFTMIDLPENVRLCELTQPAPVQP